MQEFKEIVLNITTTALALYGLGAIRVGYKYFWMEDENAVYDKKFLFFGWGYGILALGEASLATLKFGKFAVEKIGPPVASGTLWLLKTSARVLGDRISSDVNFSADKFYDLRYPTSEALPSGMGYKHRSRK